ncbi:hypothetical protein [Rhizobium pisi]
MIARYLPRLIFVLSCLLAVCASAQPSASGAPPTPAWLAARVGVGDGEIAAPVLDRARALYYQKRSQGTISNPCYFAMDATRPNGTAGDNSGGRFYVICEADRTFRVVSSGHGSGRNLKGVVDFSNGRMCARNFGNAMDSNLTAGGAYLTSETKTSFKGYYRVPGKADVPFSRTFVQFDGEGETANARQRAIGGHAAALVSGICRRKDPQNPYADREGYVAVGKLVDYSAGRSNGCTSWTQPDARQLITMMKDSPTTLYIYPESKDIAHVAAAVAEKRPLTQPGLYWNETCLKEIVAPRFWPKEKLEPLITEYQIDHPAPPPRPVPICPDP